MSNIHHIILIDEDGNVIPTLEGNIAKIQVNDMEVVQLLGDILKELKRMNIQLSLMTDTEIKNTDL